MLNELKCKICGYYGLNKILLIGLILNLRLDMITKITL